MNIYELKVGHWEPMVFESAEEALREASAFKARGRHVEVRRRKYLHGIRLGTKRLSVDAYEGADAREKAHAEASKWSLQDNCKDVTIAVDRVLVGGTHEARYSQGKQGN